MFVLLFRTRRPVKPCKIGNHTADDVKEDLKNIRHGTNVKKAAKLSGIPFTTLKRYHLNTRDETPMTPNYTVSKVFTTAQEVILKDYFTHCAMIFYGSNANECR